MPPIAFPRQASVLRGLWTAAALSAVVVAPTSGGAQDGDGSPDVVAPAIVYDIVDGGSIPEPLNGLVGDAERGRAVYTEARAGCGDCHGDPSDPTSPRSAGAPSLDRVGFRLSQGALRLWIVNPRALTDAAEKPAYYSLRPLGGPDTPPEPGPRLDAAAIEDLVAYLDRLGRDGG